MYNRWKQLIGKRGNFSGRYSSFSGHSRAGESTPPTLPEEPEFSLNFSINTNSMYVPLTGL